MKLSETKLFHFHVIFKKKDENLQSEPPHLYTYEPPSQKSWIRPRSYVISLAALV